MSARVVQVEPFERVDSLWLAPRPERAGELRRLAAAHGLRVEHTRQIVHVSGCNIDGCDIDVGDGGPVVVLDGVEHLVALASELAPLVVRVRAVTPVRAYVLDGVLSDVAVSDWIDHMPAALGAQILGVGSAVADLMRAAALAPSDVALRTRLADALLAARELDAAEKELRVVIALLGDQTYNQGPIVARIARVYLCRDAVDDALAALRAGNPRHPAIHQAYAEVYLHAHRYAEAIRHLDNAHPSVPSLSGPTARRMIEQLDDARAARGRHG